MHRWAVQINGSGYIHLFILNLLIYLNFLIYLKYIKILAFTLIKPKLSDQLANMYSSMYKLLLVLSEHQTAPCLNLHVLMLCARSCKRVRDVAIIIQARQFEIRIKQN